jgi:multiple sugar transport system permease protein
MASTSMTTSQPRVGGTGTNVGLVIRRILMVIGIAFLILFALIQTVPFILTVSNSFKCLPATRQAPEAFIPSQIALINCRDATGVSLPLGETVTGLTFRPSLEGYQEILRFPFERWFINTLIYAVFITLLRLFFDSLAGYALARMKFPGRRVVFYIIIGTLMIPAVVLIIPRFIILRELGILNTYQGLILALAADAFGVFLMKQFFESIPEEIEEAAQVDGANRMIMFFRIVLPMATPALTALTIFSFQGTWNNFMDALIIVGGNQNLWNLPLGMAQLRGQFGDTLDWNTFLAGAVFTTLPMAILFFMFQRYFVEGVSYSGLKG